MGAFLAIVKRDLKLKVKNGSSVIALLGFFVIAASLFPFGVGVDLVELNSMAAGIIWVCALLAMMLTISSVFEEDYDDGSLQQLFLSGALPEVIVMAKITAHWLASALPVIIAMPLLAILFSLSQHQTALILWSLILGTPTLSMISVIIAAIGLGIRSGGGVMNFFVLPFFIPVLIFAIGAVNGQEGGFASASFMLLLGLMLLFIPISVVATSAALKAAINA